ncbi:putative HTH-type transcriptional regulator YdcR [Ruegeria sp. THAF57]|uniref:aminotransferase-like domain-containing protein n=1 Tax=Ruegeria sp. THAF57 TaxID=2744555 RepID=UPI0015E04598|nr:PLP-dependent aminotransferase family protein [Ruegeria sp. THAF57]CAD0186817.1 putative HTH-type transcriptional regulator YdcR [Ruegeria sp. THAF57]
MENWVPMLADDGNPRYMALANAIAEDIQTGRLSVGDRLPPQRELADRLSIHFTTVARGYVEANARGLIESKVGRGTFVSKQTRSEAHVFPDRPADASMNLPPEPHDAELARKMRTGAQYVAEDIVSLLRYQGAAGNDADKQAALTWLNRRSMSPKQDRLLIVPGAQAALDGILRVTTKPGETILCENITYPGIRSLAAQHRLKLVGLAMDQHGIEPQAFQDACEMHKPKALYLNPTLQNPTTLTIPIERRHELAAIARQYNVPILEDDAYGLIPARGQQPAPFASIVPELTWHIAGLSKCIGAGLRVAYVIAPDARSAWPLLSAMRASVVMASPLTVAIVTKWIEDGTATSILRAVRTETIERNKLARHILPEGTFRSDPLCFSIWLELPQPWNRTAFVEHMRAQNIGVVASDAFVVDRAAPEAVRMCLGGPATRGQIEAALGFAAHALTESPALTSAFL